MSIFKNKAVSIVDCDIWYMSKGNGEFFTCWVNRYSGVVAQVSQWAKRKYQGMSLEALKTELNKEGWTCQLAA